MRLSPILFFPLLAVSLVAAEPEKKSEKAAKPEAPAAAPTPLTEEQKNALAAIDSRMVGLEAIVAKVDDVDYKDDCLKAVADLKKRRKALETNYDQGLTEALMHSLISRYQIVALWLTPPRLPPPAGFVPVAKPAPKKGGGSTDNAPGTY
jgi:hypothetical protein